MACIPPNPRRVEYIDSIHGPLDGPLYKGSHIHQQSQHWGLAVFYQHYRCVFGQ